MKPIKISHPRPLCAREKLATKLTKDDQQPVLLYYQPGAGLTRCQSLKVEDGGKGHKTSEV